MSKQPVLNNNFVTRANVRKQDTTTAIFGGKNTHSRFYDKALETGLPTATTCKSPSEGLREKLETALGARSENQVEVFKTLKNAFEEFAAVQPHLKDVKISDMLVNLDMASNRASRYAGKFGWYAITMAGRRDSGEEYACECLVSPAFASVFGSAYFTVKIGGQEFSSGSIAFAGSIAKAFEEYVLMPRIPSSQALVSIKDAAKDVSNLTVLAGVIKIFLPTDKLIKIFSEAAKQKEASVQASGSDANSAWATISYGNQESIAVKLSANFRSTDIVLEVNGKEAGAVSPRAAGAIILSAANAILNPEFQSAANTVYWSGANWDEALKSKFGPMLQILKSTFSFPEEQDWAKLNSITVSYSPVERKLALSGQYAGEAKDSSGIVHYVLSFSIPREPSDVSCNVTKTTLSGGYRFGGHVREETIKAFNDAIKGI